jgi:hypothetical protein
VTPYFWKTFGLGVALTGLLAYVLIKLGWE